MTFGVDQCRICGAPIPVLRPTAMQEWEEAQRKPRMSEKEWRKRGFLAVPTRRQIFSTPADGCCLPCGLQIMRKKYHYNVRGVVVVVGMVILAIFITVASIFVPQ